MLDPLLTPLAVLHFLALTGLLAWFARARLGLDRKEAPFFVLLLLWASLVLAAPGAGAFGALGSLKVYAPLTFLAAWLMAAWLRSLWRRPPAEPLLPKTSWSFAAIEHGRARRFLFWFLAGTLALFALISLIIGQCVYPDNADSMIYRLPRAFWYVGNGTLLHPFSSPDNRLLFYPLNGVSLYFPLVLYNLPGTWHALPSFVAWSAIVYATYRFARVLGAERLLALFAAWLVGMTPSVLAQATSTNDEILASGAFLCALYMGWRWLVSGRHAYFFMAGLAIGLSAGTKLHIVFLLPMIAAAVAIGLWPLRAAPAKLAGFCRAVGGRTFLSTLAIVALMFLPFLFYNYLSVGRAYFLDEFKNDVFNLSASARIGFQNLLIYLSQMIVSPVADMNAWPVANDRQAFNSSLNALVNPLIEPFLNKDPSHYHLNYRFVGVTIPVSVRFVEFSLWAGFVWLLWPLQALLAARRAAQARGVFVVLALTPPLWLLLWSFSTLYMEGTATYFSFYLVCAAPAALMAFLPIGRSALGEARWVVLAIVAFTNLVIDHNLVMYSGFRAIPDLFYARRLPYDWLLTEDGIIKEIRAADKIRVVFIHEKTPYFGYMHWHPSARYFSPFLLESALPPDVLQLLPVSSLNQYGFMPLKVPNKVTPGLTYLGAVRAIGREAIFAVGRGVETRHPDESNYLVLQAIAEHKGARGWTVSLSETPLGFAPEDRLGFAYEVRQDGGFSASREERPSPAASFSLPCGPHECRTFLTTVVTSSWSGKELTRATYQIGSGGSWLPEGSEY